ncbi:hypothetical protein [Bradyrhizobium sp. USDA 10063]
MQLIATRHYFDWIPSTGEEFDLQDRVYRKPDDSLVLMIAGELPGDPSTEQALSLPEYFEWLRDCPSQIKRAVIEGGKH